jgi:hypothetical protein
MPDHRGSRFALEALFLIALAVGLALASLKPLEIAGVMLLGWVIVAVLEWAAWRDEPHYGSGLPPRYYVPRVSLPPAQPLEQVAAGYPEAHRDEAPTWIASAALRSEVLGEWPVAPPTPPSEETADDEDGEEEDRWTRAELPAAPIGEADDEPEADTDAGTQPAIDVVFVRSGQGVARYNLDPLADPPAKRRFGRGGEVTATWLEVPARPERVRALPARTNLED